MASAAVLLLAAAAAVLLVASPATATAASGVAGCAGEKFPAGRSYAHCAALGQLGAVLHWTYDAKSASLSLAFVAKTAGAGGAGWVSWALNPTGDEMKGAQALLAIKGGGASSPNYVVNTYNITGYAPLPATSTPIAFKASDLAADESAGKLRLYGKLQLRPGMDVVNTIWQVGSTVTNGAPAKHAFAKENLAAKAKISLSGATLAPAPAPAATAGASSSAQAGSGGAATPSGGKLSAAAYVPAPMLMLLGLAGFLAIV